MIIYIYIRFKYGFNIFEYSYMFIFGYIDYLTRCWQPRFHFMAQNALQKCTNSACRGPQQSGTVNQNHNINHQIDQSQIMR